VGAETADGRLNMTILEEMKKAFLASLGGVVLTKDKLEEWRKKIVKENKMSEKESKRLIDQLVEAGEDQWEDFEKSFKKIFRKSLDSIEVADRRELEDLKLRVANLETRLAALENPPSGAEEPMP
jgi:polyhydroxyalkanoate synthesis regulator phasin